MAQCDSFNVLFCEKVRWVKEPFKNILSCFFILFHKTHIEKNLNVCSLFGLGIKTVYRSMQKLTNVYISVQKYAQICNSIQNYTK